MTGRPFGPGLPDRINGECAGFAWVGQSFAHCDICGEPYWEHEYDRQFVNGGDAQVVIPADVAARVKAKWQAS